MVVSFCKASIRTIMGAPGLDFQTCESTDLTGNPPQPFFFHPPTIAPISIMPKSQYPAFTANRL